MNADSLKYYLSKVLPDIDFRNSEISKLMRSDIRDAAKITKILSYHFKAKTSKFKKFCSVETDARYISKLFPELSFLYILEQLEIFQDMPDRREIVLRLIVRSKASSNGQNSVAFGVKRNNPNLPSSEKLNNYCNPIKIRKVTEGPTSTFTVVQEENESSKSSTAESMNEEMSPVDHSQNLEITIKEENAPEDIARPLEFPACSEHPPVLRINFNYLINHRDNETTDDFPTASLLKENSTSADEQYINDSDLAVQTEYEISSLNEVPDTIEQMNAISFASNAQIIKENTSRSQNCTDNELDEIFEAMDKMEDYVTSNLQSVNQFELPVGVLTESDVLDMSQRGRSGGSQELQELLAEGTVINEQPEDASRITGPSSPCLKMPIEIPPQEIFAIFQNSLKDENEYFNTPSTSKESDIDMTEEQEDFNLVQYLKDFTNAPMHFIQQQCNKLKVSNWKRPSTPVLHMLIDSLLTNDISSESSDSDENESQGNINVAPNQLINSVRLEPDNKLKSLNCADSQLPHSNLEQSKATVIVKAFSTNSQNGENVSLESNTLVDGQLVNYLCSIFPDACPQYIKGLCRGKLMNNEVLDELTTIILSSNDQYPKRPQVSAEPEVYPENQLEILKEFLPDADPDYLRMKCDDFEGKPDKVKAFINDAMEHRNYPTMKEYLRRQQLSAQQKQYTTEFSVENFIKVIPDPHSFFSDPSRAIKMDALSSHYALVFLRNTFNKLPVRVIQSVFTKNNCKLCDSFKELQSAMKQTNLLMKGTRKPIEMPNSVQNIPLLQEVAYYSHRKEINQYLQQIKEKEETERREALSHGLLKICACCYDEEVLPKDIFCCESGCAFCKSCIVKSTEVRFGEGKLDFPCLMNCPSNFSLQTLQAVLSPKLFSKIAQKKALEEIKSAGIEELETCPFCDFATIPAEGYNIFTCMNPECMKESCRLCKEPSHIPLRCDEIEKDEDVRARIFVENQMTEALLKKCWKCGIKFFKEEGCNKMTCSCGAQMCYICGQPVTDYTHFNGNGGDRFDLCPLYSDSNALNQENVLKGAEQAKSEIGNKPLKHDPTVDVQKHYKERAAKLPPQPVNVNLHQGAEFYARAFNRLEPRHLHHFHRHNHHHHHRHHQEF